MTFEEINPGIWVPTEAGESITGIFIKSEKDVGPNKSMLYHLEVDRKPQSVWGCTILDQRMIYVEPGNRIRITYKGLGEAKSGSKNPPKIFSVEIDKDEQVHY
jgi:hypothetical protein